mmetsp:Transcript_9368/g.26292  ORF Transcript_9368/g.26292 Transcript_9368/m.26292 type:complete len:339 (+) Transcript_9368:265-1281(+)
MRAPPEAVCAHAPPWLEASGFFAPASVRRKPRAVRVSPIELEGAVATQYLGAAEARHQAAEAQMAQMAPRARMVRMAASLPTFPCGLLWTPQVQRCPRRAPAHLGGAPAQAEALRAPQSLPWAALPEPCRGLGVQRPPSCGAVLPGSPEPGHCGGTRERCRAEQRRPPARGGMPQSGSPGRGLRPLGPQHRGRPMPRPEARPTTGDPQAGEPCGPLSPSPPAGRAPEDKSSARCDSWCLREVQHGSGRRTTALTRRRRATARLHRTRWRGPSKPKLRAPLPDPPPGPRLGSTRERARQRAASAGRGSRGFRPWVAAGPRPPIPCACSASPRLTCRLPR